MPLIPLIDDRSARIAARMRLRRPSNAVVDDGIDLRREPVRKAVAVQEVQDEIELHPEPEIQSPPGDYFGRKQVAIRDIVKAAAAHYNVSEWEVLSARRNAAVIPARQAAMYLAKKLTLWSLPYIGQKLGGKDHTTVLHAIRKIEDRLPRDQCLSAHLAAIEDDLRNGRAAAQALFPTKLLPRDSVTVDQIKAATSYYYDISEAYILSRSVHTIPLLARRVAAYLTLEMTSLSNPEIQAAFKRAKSSYFPYNCYWPIKQKRSDGDVEIEGDIAAIVDVLRRKCAPS